MTLTSAWKGMRLRLTIELVVQYILLEGVHTHQYYNASVQSNKLPILLEIRMLVVNPWDKSTLTDIEQGFVLQGWD